MMHGSKRKARKGNIFGQQGANLEIGRCSRITAFTALLSTPPPDSTFAQTLPGSWTTPRTSLTPTPITPLPLSVSRPSAPPPVSSNMPSAVVDAAFTAAPAALRSAPPSTGAAAVGARLGAACRHRPGARLAWRAAADGGGKDDGGGGAGDAAGGGAKKGFGGAAKAATPVKGGAKAIPPPPPPPGRGLPDLSVDERQRLEARDASGVSMMDRLQVGGRSG